MLVHSRTLRIEWSDCDPAGIVFYPRYFAMFDDGTAHLFERATGLKKAAMTAKFEIYGIPLANTSARFLKPLRFGDDVTHVSEMAEFRRSSFDVRHRIEKAGELSVEAIETRVWVERHPDDPNRMRGKPVPEAVIKAFAG